MGSNKVEDISNQQYGKSREHEADFSGPMKDRSCTDILCLLIFIVFLCGWVAVGIYSFTKGNPERLVYPSNSKGEICGKGNYKDSPYLLFFDLTRCISPTVVFSGCPTPQVCVKACPDQFMRPYGATGDQSQLKRDIFPYCGPEMTIAMITDTQVTLNSLVDRRICPPWVMPSNSFLGRCVPFFSHTDSNATVQNDTVLVSASSTANGKSVMAGDIRAGVAQLAKLMDVRTFGEKVFNDLAKSWWIVLLGVIVATLVALGWVILMRFVAAVMIWSSLLLSTLLLILSCVYCILKYNSLKNVSEAQNSWFDQGFTTNLSVYSELSATWLILFFISLILLIVILILLIFLRKRIRIAIELIEEASIAVGRMMSTLFFPLLPFVLDLVLVAWWILVSVFLASSGEQHFVVSKDSCNATGIQSQLDQGLISCVSTGNGSALAPQNVTAVCPLATCEFLRYGKTATANYLQIYNLFGLLWGLFFLGALEEMVMAGAFASWYFARDKKTDVPIAPLTASCYRTLRFHLGTLAFGSLIIAIIRMIRIMIEYIEQKMKEYNQDNRLVKCVLCCCRCCFWCLESFMKFINRNAYIMTAIYGKNFCWSAKESFSLLMRNFARVFVLDKITDFLLLLGKLVVVCSIAVLSFYVFSGRIGYIQSNDLNYYLLPVILVTLGAYFVADIFFGVYEMAVDTIFLCFLEDLERNDGSPEKPYYMSMDLRKILHVETKE